MADNNNIPEAEDTKTRVTAKITPGTPGKSAEPIDLDAQAPASNTVTRRTLKLQGLAGLTATPSAGAAPKPAAAAQPEGDNDTRTRRTVKLSSLAAGPAVKPLNTAKPVTPAPAPAAPAQADDADSTMTRRTQKLTALDTKEVAAMTAADLSTPAAKLSAVATQPAPAEASSPRKTVKVDGIAPAHTPAIDLNAKVGDTNTRRTAKIEMPPTAPAIDLNASSPDDTRTKKATKVAPEQFKNNNVDDTVKLQRPAPKPAMPGSIAPAAAPTAAQPGGIKLNKPAAPAPKVAIKPAPAPVAAAVPAPEPEAAPAAAPAAEPTGNLGKDQAPPKEKKGLKVNTEALEGLGSAPLVQGDAPAPVAGGVPKSAGARNESTGLNVTFAFFGVIAALVMIFIALVAVTDYFNIWHPSESGRVDLPIISEHVYNNITIKK